MPSAHIAITRQIAEEAKCNVRAAMADLEMWLGEVAISLCTWPPLPRSAVTPLWILLFCPLLYWDTAFTR